jgi:uncharacterized membrane-anchored protein
VCQPRIRGLFGPSSLRLVLVVVVVVVVWRSRSDGVAKDWWWGACLRHVVVGALKSMCQ